MKVSPSDENDNRQSTGRGYKEPVQSAMLQSSSLPLTAASRTRASNNVRNENSDSTSHSNEDGGFSEFIAYLRLSEEAQQMQTVLCRREKADGNTKKDQWQCYTCSYINKNPLHLTCDICGTVRVGHEPEDDIIKEQLEEKKGMGIENFQGEEDDAPIPAAQIAARYESMEGTAKKPELNEDDEDSPPLPPWQIGCQDENLNTKKSYVTTPAPPPISDCQSSTPSTSDVVVPPSTSDEDIEQNSMPNSVQPQVEIIIHRPPPPSMLPRQSDDDEEEEPTADLPSLPQIEATAVEDVVYDAIAVRSDANQGNNASWWKRNQKYIIVGLIALVMGGLIATVATLAGSKDDANIVDPLQPTVPINDTPNTTTSKTTTNTTSTTQPSTPFKPTTELWKQQGQSIVGNSAGDYSGWSISLSSYGETLAIGSPGNYTFPSDDRIGYAKIYQRSSDGGEWKLDQTILGEAHADRLGYSVCLSGDGNTVALGAPGSWERNDRPGYVKVYRTNDGYWNQLGQAIKGEAFGDQFGIAVSLSADGKTLAVGANANDGNSKSSGHVRVFGLDDAGSTWKQRGQDIDGESGGGFHQSGGDQSGWSVSLSSDGKTLAVGAKLNNNEKGVDSGHVRVFGLEGNGPSTSWKQLGQDIDGEAAHDQSGGSVSLSADGKTLAIGAHGNDGNGDRAGHVRVFILDEAGSSWNQLGQDIDGEAAFDNSGRSVSLSADGNVVAVGANRNDGHGYLSGHVRVYHMDDNGSSWKQIGQDIDGESEGDHSGFSSLSADGRTVSIGSHGNDGNGEISGHVRVFNQAS